MTFYSAETTAVNTEQRYLVYDAETGYLLRHYTLNPLAAQDNTRQLIGKDDRVVDWSKSGTVKLMGGTNYQGSGFIVDSHTIATAAHCVYTVENSNFKEISGINVFNANGSIALTATPVEIHIPLSYVGNNQTYISNYDYALITVKEDLSDYDCFNFGVPLDSIGSSPITVKVTGFPGEFNNQSTHRMYTGVGNTTGISDYMVNHNADTTSGNSGGPVYITENRCGYTYYSVIAINVAHPTHESLKYNIGTRITTDLIHFYKNNPNLIWE